MNSTLLMMKTELVLTTALLASTTVSATINSKLVADDIEAIANNATTTQAYSHSSTAVDFYGKLNVSINDVNQDSSNPVIDEWQLNSNASRIGIKGSYTINENFEAIFQLEYQVEIDDGQSSSSKGSDTFEQRNSFVGLRGDFGSLIAGKHDTPLKLAQGKIDRFNDQLLGDIKNYLEGEDRVNNIVMLSTANFNGFSGSAALIAGEDSTATANEKTADGTSISLNYKNSWIRAAIARNDDVDAQDTHRAVAEFNWRNSKLGMLVQRVEQVDGTVEEDSWLLSGSQQLSEQWRLNLQYGQTDYDSNQQDIQRVIGVERKLDKSTRLFAYYASIERANTTGSVTDSSFALGYEIKF